MTIAGPVYENVARFFSTPHDKPPRYVLIITAYLDESEHSISRKYMTVAGFVGNDEQWKSLVGPWTAALGKKKALHMNQLRLNSKPDRARQLLSRLGPIPYQCGLSPVAGIVRVSDYEDIVANMRIKEGPYSGYAVCLSAIMVALNRTVAAQHSIKIVCEMQQQYERSAQKVFKGLTIAMSNPAYPYFAGLDFIPKHSSLLTQPADYLAFALTKNYEDSDSLAARLCRTITPTEQIRGYFVSRDKIREIMTRLKRKSDGKL
jgi:hypothetical protein